MINWRTIRIHNQSQNNAFEELVCQFARHNPPNDSKDFNRLGTPDGGVECYWKLNNGKEIGWQAKYVFSVEDLISQIDKSIKTAIKNHPNMNIYISLLHHLIFQTHSTLVRKGSQLKVQRQNGVKRSSIGNKNYQLRETQLKLYCGTNHILMIY